jgi:AraC-like DNA-binding protein
MMFNDAGLTGVPVDEARQAQAAVLCSLLGTLLDPRRGGFGRRVAIIESRGQRLVSSTLAMLDEAPGRGGKEIAAALGISVSRLARVFKEHAGMSLVEYRNRLRLDRFAALLDGGCENLLKAALDAGFGSYAQFHRVFRARLNVTPRQYLRPAGSGLRGAEQRR